VLNAVSGQFQEIYFTEYGEALTLEEATTKAESLLRLYKSVLKPSDHKGPPNKSNDHTGTIEKSRLRVR